MGQALLGGLIGAGWAKPGELLVAEISAQGRGELESLFPGIVVAESPQTGVDSLIAVKPHIVRQVCEGLIAPRRVVSIAAGVTIETMETCLPDGTPVIRVMPNTPSLVGAGASALAGGRHTSPTDIRWAESILAAVGEVVVVDEHLLDAVTGLSGSGPAYVFLIIEAMIDAGIAAGLPADISSTLAIQTVLGAAQLASQSDLSPGQLRAGVTTPAGTTAAGLRILEQRATRAAVIDAVIAAANRSKEMGS